MKYWVLSILITIFVGQKSYAQESSDTVRAVLLGNDPNATLTTGIGQVLQPVGIPVVQPPASSVTNPIQTTPPPTPSALKKQSGQPGETKGKTEGLYELGEVPRKTPIDQKVSKRAAATEVLLSNQVFGGDEVYSKVPTQKAKEVERIRIPYSNTPPVQEIPYR